MSPLKRFFSRHKLIALDASVFIYSLDANPKYVTLAREVLAWVEQPTHAAITSTITMTELLVKPYRTVDEKAISRLYDVLVTYPNLQWVAPDIRTADLAARFRAVHGLKTADALHAATAVRSGATALVTNDATFERIHAFETLMFDRLL